MTQRNFKINKLFLKLILALFVVVKSSFSYQYNPIIFNVFAEYIVPLKIELENDGDWDLGRYVLGSNSLIKRKFFIKAKTAPNKRIKLTVTGVSSDGYIDLYKDGIISSDKVIIQWDLDDNEFTTDATGSYTSGINFFSVTENGNPLDGNYSLTSPMVINMNTL